MRLCEQHGRVLAEYVEVPWSLLKETDKLQSHFATSLKYVGSLKPKPMKKKTGTGNRKNQPKNRPA